MIILILKYSYFLKFQFLVLIWGEMILKPSIYCCQFEYIIFKEFLKMRAKNQKWLKKSSMTPDFSKYWYVKCNYKYMRIILRKIFTQNITSWALKWKGLFNLKSSMIFLIPDYSGLKWSYLSPEKSWWSGTSETRKFNLSTFCVKQATSWYETHDLLWI